MRNVRSHLSQFFTLSRQTLNTEIGTIINISTPQSSVVRVAEVRYNSLSILLLRLQIVRDTPAPIFLYFDRTDMKSCVQIPTTRTTSQPPKCVLRVEVDKK